MTMRKKDRPSLDGGFVKLQRRLLKYLRVELELSPELSFFYIQLLAAAKYHTEKRPNRYPGTLGNIDPEVGPIAEWSFRDIAACCFVTVGTARRNIELLQRKGLVRHCRLPGTDEGAEPSVWYVGNYTTHIADDAKPV